MPYFDMQPYFCMLPTMPQAAMSLINKHMYMCVGSFASFQAECQQIALQGGAQQQQEATEQLLAGRNEVYKKEVLQTA